MAFKVKIKNIGKLENAEVCIGQFTVFAGPNNTGKSFVSKLLYSIFNAMNANHVETLVNDLFRPVYESLMIPMRLELIGRRPDKATISWQSSLENEIKKLEDLVKEASNEEFKNENIILEDIIPDLTSQIEKIEQIAVGMPWLPKTKIGEMKETDQKYLEILTNSFAEMKEKLPQTNAEDFINMSVY